MDMVIVFLVSLLVGIFIGWWITYARFYRQSCGTLRIDNSDGEGPYLFLELATDVRNIYDQKSVRFTVKKENYVSHK